MYNVTAHKRQNSPTYWRIREHIVCSFRWAFVCNHLNIGHSRWSVVSTNLVLSDSLSSFYIAWRWALSLVLYSLQTVMFPSYIQTNTMQVVCPNHTKADDLDTYGFMQYADLWRILLVPFIEWISRELCFYIIIATVLSRSCQNRQLFIDVVKDRC